MAVRHPAKYTASIIDVMRDVAERYLPFAALILDPFAGVGTIHELFPYRTYGVEMEEEWAHQHPRTTVGDSRHLSKIWDGWCFDAIFTSPCYGNRMADHHDAKDASRRNTYRHAIGRPLTDGNAGAMQWGEEYRQLHRDVYAECVKVLRPDGLFVLNMSNHIRKGVEVDVTGWHVGCLMFLGFDVIEQQEINTPRQRQGANGHLRVGHEDLVVMRLG